MWLLILKQNTPFAFEDPQIMSGMLAKRSQNLSLLAGVLPNIIVRNEM